MTRSLRFRLAARAAGGMTSALVLISITAFLGARDFLDPDRAPLEHRLEPLLDLAAERALGRRSMGRRTQAGAWS